MKKCIIFFLFIILSQLLYSQVSNTTRKLVTGHKSTIQSISISNDRNLLLSSSGDKSIKLWDLNSFKLIKPFLLHTGTVKNVKWFQDNKRFASCSVDATIKIWDIQSGDCIRNLNAHSDAVTSFVLTNYEKKIISASNDNTVKFWDISTGKCVKTIDGYTDPWSLSINSNNTTFAFLSINRIFVFDIDKKKPQIELSARSNKICFGKDDNLLFSLSDNKVNIIDIKTSTYIKAFANGTKTIKDFDISSDGNVLIVSSNDEIIFFDIKSGVEIARMSTYIATTNLIRFLPNSHSEYIRTVLDSGNNFVTNFIPNNNTSYPINDRIIEDVDTNIPTIKITNNNTFAVVIANENYNDEVRVDYAINGTIFKQYCEKTLGIPVANIHFIKDATYGKIIAEKDWLANNLKAYKGDVKAIFYYAGHGIPGGEDKPAYLLPVDGTSSNISSALKLDDLYSTLATNPNKGVTVFLDACFSGSTRDAGMLASARGTKLKPRESTLPGNMVVFSAASGDETAWPYKDKQHGMFTYYLLKRLQETKGDDLSSLG